MKVLITGGNGLLGHNTILQLLSEGHTVHAIVRKSASLLVQHDNLQVFEGSFLDYDSLLLATQGCEAIIHTAAATDMSLSYSQFERVNVGGSSNVVAVARALGIKKLVYVSTLNTIGYGLPERLADESCSMQYPFTHAYYAITKAMAEGLFLEEAKYDGRHVVIINPGFMLGEYDTKPSSGQLMLMAYRKPIMVVPQGGKCFVHVKDVASAIVNALTLGRNAERYIVGAHNKTLAELYKLQKNVCGYKQLLVPIPCWITNMVGMFGDVLRKIGLHTQVCSMNTKQLCVREYYSNAKAKTELKMSETSLERAISDSICWLKRNR